MPQGSEQAAGRLTGRHLITAHPDARQHLSSKLAAIGVPPAYVGRTTIAARPLPAGHHLMLERMGIAVVYAPPDKHEQLQSLAMDDAVVAVEPERIVRALSISTSDAGSQDTRGETPTWGLIATRVLDSAYTGAGIKLAVLDTGFDLTHPDFAGRSLITANFVGDSNPFHDGVGHGTYCMGIAAGPRVPIAGPRYGIACEVVPCAGRVLDDVGQGGDFNVLQGIDWAISMGCSVICLALGAPWTPGSPPFSEAYEAAAQRALDAGSLVVAAAGNEAANPAYMGAVGPPGSCPSVLTVAAVDRTLTTAAFSNRQMAGAPGVKGPDIAAPGVDIYSAWSVVGGRYRTLSGTSMAVPYVAGIAALLAQSDSALRGRALKDEVLRLCLHLGTDAARQPEIGRGLVQAL